MPLSRSALALWTAILVGLGGSSADGTTEQGGSAGAGTIFELTR